jgi:phenylacetate-CoA ligase
VSRRARGGVSRNAAGYLGELGETQWLPRDELAQLQLRRLRRLLQHASGHVGYYRELLQTAGITPEDIRTAEDLGRLPVLSRQALHDNLYFDLFADTHRARNIVKLTTSGATGEPLAVFADRLQLEMRWAHAMRGAEWAGYRFPARRLRWSRAVSPRSAVRDGLTAWRSRLRILPATALDDGLADRYADAVRRERPALLEGDAEAFNVVATLLRARGRDARGAGALRTWGQTLTPAVRTFLEDVFGCPVFDEYGAGELGPIAHECEAHAGYHVNAESYVVEVVRDGRPAADGELGEVLVTDLNGRSLPLVRYQLSDLAALTTGACPCGRSLPRLERIVGRPLTAVLATEDRCVPGSVFAEVFNEFPHAVMRYQILQEERDALTVQLVRRSRFTADTERAIRELLARVLGPGMRVTLDLVESLPGSPGPPRATCTSTLPVPLSGDAERPGSEPGMRREVFR